MYTQIKLQFRAILDQVFPLYADVFADLYGKTSLQLLLAYPTPEAVLKAGLDEIQEKMLTFGFQSKSSIWIREKAKKIMTAAQNSPNLTAIYESHLYTLPLLISMLLQYQEHLEHLEKEIERMANSMEEYELIRTVPGIGKRIAATILSEIGDIHQFSHAKKLVAFAGIDPSVFSSGKFHATSNRITKRGSKRLRRAIFLAVLCGIRGKAPNLQLRQYYNKKRLEGKTHKVAIIACANKLLRILFAILSKAEKYRLDTSY
jgi:hypothetical protein